MVSRAERLLGGGAEGIREMGKGAGEQRGSKRCGTGKGAAELRGRQQEMWYMPLGRSGNGNAVKTGQDISLILSFITVRLERSCSCADYE